MDIHKITTYSLLAHINNSSIGINDLSEIFIPIVKRTLSSMNSEGFTKGSSLEEIKNRVDNTFKLDIPYPLLRKIITKIADEENKDGSINFAYHKDGSFIIKNFVFADYEEIIQDQEIEINFIQESYHNYLRINQVEIESQPSIFEFLDSNRIMLSQYFAHKVEHQATLDYTLQANFINNVKDIPKIYNVLRKIYLGSIITSYLEVDYGDIKRDVEFLLDTNFIVGLLDLNSIESKHTCRKIIEICHRLGYKVSVLDFTIEETSALINRTADNYETTFLAKKIDPESIYNACDRKNLSRTDLQGISANLYAKLHKEFRINLIPNTVKYRNIAKYSNEFEKFKGYRTNQLAALHDATAVVYVQNKRGKKVTSFQEANCWFVTNVSHGISHFKTNGFLPEIIRAEDLVNLLWLTNPMVKAGETTEIGLTRLVSCAISNSLPSARVIKELDENIQKYAQDKVDAQDIVRVADVIANKTLVNLEYLNKIAKSNSEEFVKKLKDVSDKEKQTEMQRQLEIKKLLLKIKSDSEEKVKQTIDEIRETNNKSLEIHKTTITASYIDKEYELRSQKRNHFLETYNNLDQMKQTYDSLSDKRASRYILTFFGISFLLVGTGIYFASQRWSVFEPWTLVFGFVPAFLGYLYFVIMRQEFSIPTLWLQLKTSSKNRYYKRHRFNYDYYEYLKNQIEELSKSDSNN
jgi:hypothetical protein